MSQTRDFKINPTEHLDISDNLLSGHLSQILQVKSEQTKLKNRLFFCGAQGQCKKSWAQTETLEAPSEHQEILSLGRCPGSSTDCLAMS